MFIEQITTSDGLVLFTLLDLKFSSAALILPKPPVWFIELQNLLLHNDTDRNILPQLQRLHKNRINTRLPVHIKSITHFTVGWHYASNSAVVSKVLKIKSDVVHIQHYHF